MSPMPTGASLIADGKAKTAGTQSSYGCYLTTLTTDTDLPYTFWSVYLHYPEHIISDAGDAKASYKYRLKDDEGKIYLLANCVIPATNKAASLVDDLLRDSIREYEKSQTSDNTSDSALTSNSGLWCNLPNIGGYSCPPDSCWLDGDQDECLGYDGETLFLPEVIKEAEVADCEYVSCGGGGPTWPPPSDEPDDPWVPDDGGNGGGPCLTCEPGDDPNNDGEQICPMGTIADGNGGCIGEEEDPCETNLIQLQQTFPNTSTDILEDLTTLINSHASDFGIDSDEKMQHFLSQAGHESSNFAGVTFSAFTENLNYRVNLLGVEYWTDDFNPVSNPTQDPNKENPLEYAQYPGSTFVDHEKFANYVYNDQNRFPAYKLGNTNPGDGYKFRGRGIIQLTGRDNYERFNTFYQNNYDSTVNLISNPDLLSNNTEIAVISALWFFENNVLNKLDIDHSTTVLEVTEFINGGDNGIDDRENKFNIANQNINCI